MKVANLCWAVACSLLIVGSGQAQPNNNNPVNDISKPGPLVGNLGAHATIQVPKGYRFIGDRAGIDAFNRMTENPSSPNDLGFILPDQPDENWFIVFVYSDDGYVKDDDRDNLDANAILASRKEMTEAGNANRKAQGFPELEVVDWSQPPFYDPKTNNLTWGIRIRDKASGAVSVNYESRLLGRKGYFSAVLVGSPDEIPKIVPGYDNLLKNFNYANGERYSDFRNGDKIAQYTLATLAAGGLIALAAKSGLLGKLLKPLLFVGAAIIFAVGKFFKKIFGIKDKAE